MARGRMLNRKISLNKDVARLVNEAGIEAGLVYTWLIAHLDRDGRHHGDPEIIKAQVCPRISGVTPDHIRTMCGVAQGIGLLNWYEVDGEMYLEYPNFSQNQRHMKYDREGPTEFPPNSGVSPDVVRTTSPLREEKGKEEKGSQSLSEKEGLKISTIEQLGFKQLGQLGGSSIVAMRQLMPITQSEMDDALKTPAKGWKYLAKVIISQREQAANQPPEGSEWEAARAKEDKRNKKRRPPAEPKPPYHQLADPSKYDP